MAILVNSADPVPALRQLLKSQAGIPAAGGDQEISLLTKVAVNLQEQYSQSYIPTGQAFVFEGDSLTAGTTSPNVLPYPTSLATLSAIDGFGTVFNVATPGNTLTDITSQYAAQVYPRRPAAGYSRSTLCVWIGANDFPTVTSAATYYASLASYWATARADGFYVVAFTILKRTDTGITSLAMEEMRQRINKLIRSSAAYDLLIDVDQMFPDPDDSAWYLSGGIHINDAANQRLALYLNANLNGHGVTLPPPILKNPEPWFDSQTGSTFPARRPAPSLRPTRSQPPAQAISLSRFGSIKVTSTAPEGLSLAAVAIRLPALHIIKRSTFKRWASAAASRKATPTRSTNGTTSFASASPVLIIFTLTKS